jgi:translocation and assembly module TamB
MQKNSNSTPDTEATATVVAPKYSRLRRLIGWLLFILIIPVFLLTLALAFVDSQMGRDWLVKQINYSGVAKLQAIDGSLWSDFALRGLVVNTADIKLAVDKVSLAWSPYSLLARDLSLDELSIGHLEIDIKSSPPDKAPSPPPTSITLPIGLHIDRAQIARLSIKGSPDIDAIRFKLASNGRFHQITLDQLRLKLPQVDATLKGNLALVGSQPFVTSGQLALSGKVENQPLQSQIKLDGELRKLQLSGDINSNQLKAMINARLDLFAPYTYQLLSEGQIKLQQLNPAVLMPSLPKALLDVSLTVLPLGENAASGSLEIHNAMPLTVDQGGLPFTQISSKLGYLKETVTLQSMSLDLLGQGQIKGAGQLDKGRLKLQVDLAKIDPAKLFSRQPPASLGGTITLKGPWLAPDVLAKLADAQRNVALDVDMGWINPKHERRIALRQARLSRANGSVSLQGEFGLLDAKGVAKNDFKLAGEFAGLNPAEFVASPKGSLTGQFKVAGALQPALKASVDYSLGDSRFNGEVLSGKGQLNIEETRVSNADLWLALGANRIDAEGALGLANDVLKLKISLPQLQQFGPGFAGKISGDAQLKGAMLSPQIATQLAVAGLQTPFGVSVNQAALEAELQSDLKGPMRIRADISDAKAAGVQIQSLNFKVDGSRAKHSASLQLKGKQEERLIDVSSRLEGGLNEQWVWRGNVLGLQVNQPVALNLAAATPLELGAGLLRLGDARLLMGDTRLHIERLVWQEGRLDTAGELEQVSVAQWLSLLGQNELDGNLMLGGRWALKSAGSLDGQLEIHRQSGDLRYVTHNTAPQKFDLQNLKLQINAKQSALNFTGNLSSGRFGQMQASGSALVDAINWRLAERAPVDVLIKGDLPKLAMFGPLLGPDLTLAGSGRFEVRHAGLLQENDWTGFVYGDGLAVRDAATGLALQEGKVRIALDKQQIILQQFQFKGGQGSLDAKGSFDLAGPNPSATAQVSANKLTLISKADMLVVMSGQGNITLKDKALSVSGKLKADEGDIRFQANDVPKLSDDVVIKGREKPVVEAGPKLSLQMDIDLGNNFRFRAYGLDARLMGLLRLRTQANQSPTAHGVVQVAENTGNQRSTYSAYGQKLDIERGVLAFQGPIDNPGLDILAMRRGQQVEAGVQVSGSVLRPKVQLYSEPSVPDSEKLSWLLFGHGSDSMEKSDSALMLQVANALLSSDDGSTGFTEGVLGKVGLDDVGFSSQKEKDGTSTQVVSVGKQLSKNVRVSLEKSINGLRDAVKFTWQLTKGWSLVSRIGTDETTGDAYYTFSFD